MTIFNKYFYNSNKSKLYFRDCVTVLKDLFYEHGGSALICSFSFWPDLAPRCIWGTHESQLGSFHHAR
jgi:hypothetical protein